MRKALIFLVLFLWCVGHCLLLQLRRLIPELPQFDLALDNHHVLDGSVSRFSSPLYLFVVTVIVRTSPRRDC